MHPGGVALTKRTAEVADLKTGLKVLDVSSGRGTQSIFYGKQYGVDVTGIDISEEMVRTATRRTKEAGLDNKVNFRIGDSQNLPFEDNTFDVVINECAVGIPDDPQKVLDEALRVLKIKGKIVIHESTWLKQLPISEKEEIADRGGTTPFELKEWIGMLERAGAKNIVYELEQWSKPEMFYQIRENRKVENMNSIMSFPEKMKTMARIYLKYGMKGIKNSTENGRIISKAVYKGKLGYCLFKGEK